MSDSYLTIVPDAVESDEAEALAEFVLDYLVSRRIVRQEPSDCALGLGHAPGTRFQEAIEGDDFGLKSLLTNGMEVIIERSVFHNGFNGLERIDCPSCGADVHDTPWGNWLDEWFRNTGKDRMACPNCKVQRSITEYTFHPIWGFGNLGFKFWNWPPLQMEFIREIERLVKRPVKVVMGRL